MALNLEVISPRFGESLYVMLQASRTLLNDMYLCKKVKCLILKQKGMESICKNLYKKYPTFSSSVLKNKEIQSKANELIQALDIYYNGVIYLGKFRLLMNALLLAIGQLIQTINLKLSNDILLMLLEIISNYVCSILFFIKIDDIKTMTGMYALAFEHVNGKAEPNFNGVSQFITDYSGKTIKKLVDEFENFPLKLQAIAESILSDIQLKCIDAEQMKAGFTYSILSNSHELAIPPLCNYPMLQITSGFDLLRWFFFCIIVCPSSIQPGKEIERILQLILINFDVIQLHKDEYIYPHRELVSLLEIVKGSSKLIKHINENHQNSLNTMINHKNKRQHIKNILMETVPMIQDQPGLLGPKFVQLLTLYKAAIAELKFYAAHMLPDNFRINKRKEFEISVDADLCVILHYLVILKNLFMDYKFIVHNYFHQFLMGHDVEAMKYMLANAKLSSFEKTCFTDNIQFISNLPPVEYGTVKDNLGIFKIYIDWIRMQSKFIDRNSPITFQQNLRFVITLNNAAFHALIVDDVSGFLQHHLDLTPIVFHHKLIEAIFREAYNTPNLSFYLLSIPVSLQHFDPYSCYVGSQEIQMFYELHVAMITNYMESISAKLFVSFSSLLRLMMYQCFNLDDNTTALIWINSVIANKNLSTRRFIFPLPHSYKDEMFERISYFGAQTEEEMHELDVIWSMANCITCFPKITLGGLVFNVAMWLAPNIEESLIQTIKQIHIPAQDGPDSNFEIRKPSKVLALFKSIYEGISLLGNLLQCDFTHIFASVLISECLMMTPDSPVTTLTTIYADWYMENILGRRNRAEGMLFSPVRNSFVVRVSSSLPIEEYTDTHEMTALATLLGPYGVSAIINKLMEMIITHMEEIKKLLIPLETHIKLGMKNLIDLTSQYDDFYKKWKTIEEFSSLLVQIGTIFEFKNIILDGLEASQKSNESMSLLRAAIRIHQNKSDALKTMPNFIEISSGSTLIGDNLLPYLMGKEAFSSGEKEFWTNTFLGSLALVIPYFSTKEGIQYLPLLGAHTNNLHLIVTTINHLVFPIIKLYETTSRPREIVSVLQGFYDNLGLAMLRMSNGTLFTAPLKSKEVIMILYDKVVIKGFKITDITRQSRDSIPFTQNNINPTDIVPYSLISYSYASVLQNAKSRRRPNNKETSRAGGT